MENLCELFSEWNRFLQRLGRSEIGYCEGVQMTHDELRDYIDKFDCAGMVRFAPIDALRTVVELHKPIKDDFFNVGEIICEECTREEYTQIYPCPTIQAIEKDLA